MQIVEHNSDTAFPVTADPQIDWGWEKRKQLEQQGGCDAIRARRNVKCLEISVSTTY